MLRRLFPGCGAELLATYFVELPLMNFDPRAGDIGATLWEPVALEEGVSGEREDKSRKIRTKLLKEEKKVHP